MRFALLTVLFLVVFSGCSNKVIDVKSTLPKTTKKVTIFALHNYTDTPRAGMRASNIINGVFINRGYIVSNHIEDGKLSISKMQEIAKKEHSDFFVYGGISEWRYKTGIDGEPAVSLTFSLYNTSDASVKWSATGSDSQWGVDSLGTTAHSLILDMIQTK